MSTKCKMKPKNEDYNAQQFLTGLLQEAILSWGGPFRFENEEGKTGIEK